MNQSLLYRPRWNWQIWAALIVATLLHVSAVVVAEHRPQELPPVPLVGPEQVEVFVETPPEPHVEESLPDPEELPPPPQPDAEIFITDETPTPPPLRKPAQRIAQPLVRPTAAAPSGPATMRTAKVLALTAPRPEYPYEARRQRITGSGVAVLKVDFASGRVTDVQMARSTGSPVLDNATISTFKRWRFKPGTVSKVQSPITYTLTGASY